jgi:hypothetical protein
VEEQEITIALTALMGLASYLWRLLSEEKLWKPERWFYLIVSWSVFTYNAIRLIENMRQP